MKRKGIFGCVAAMTLAGVGAIAACGYGGPVCSAIDLAAQACPLVVQFTDDAGKQQTMQITHQDARELHSRKEAARKAAESKADPDAATRWP